MPVHEGLNVVGPGSGRHRSVGGTMVARILSLSKWGGPLSAYFELLGGDDGVDRAAAGAWLSRGKALEESVLAMLAERDEFPVIRPPETRISAERYPDLATALPHAHATLDAVQHRKDSEGCSIWFVVDAKTASSQEMGEEWGLDGTDQIPVDYQLQLLWYIGVCKAAGMNVADEALLPTLCGPETELQWAARLVTKTGRPLALADLEGTGLELRVYRVAWDAALFEEVNRKVVAFLREHVWPRRPPETTEADALKERDMRAVARGLKGDGSARDFASLPPADQAVLLEVLEASRQRKRWTALEEQAIARAQVALAAVEEVRGLPGGARVTWKTIKGGARRFEVKEPRK